MAASSSIFKFEEKIIPSKSPLRSTEFDNLWNKDHNLKINIVNLFKDDPNRFTFITWKTKPNHFIDFEVGGLTELMDENSSYAPSALRIFEILKIIKEDLIEFNPQTEFSRKIAYAKERIQADYPEVEKRHNQNIFKRRQAEVKAEEETIVARKTM